jgi:hypothetical protein
LCFITSRRRGFPTRSRRWQAVFKLLPRASKVMPG